MNNELQKERLTKISNYTMTRILQSYNEMQLKFFFLVLNKAISGHYAKAKDGENYRNNVLGDLCFEIPTSFIKEYSSKSLCPEKVSKAHPNSMDKIFKELCTIGLEFNIDGNKEYIPVFKKTIYDSYRSSFIVVLNEYAAEYLIMIDKDYSKVDLEILKQLHGKYEIGTYFIYCRYKEFRKNSNQAMDIQTLSNIMNNTLENRVMINQIKKAAIKINKILNKNNKTNDKDYISPEPTKYNRRITGINFKF